MPVATEACRCAEERLDGVQVAAGTRDPYRAVTQLSISRPLGLGVTTSDAVAPSSGLRAKQRGHVNPPGFRKLTQAEWPGVRQVPATTLSGEG